MKPNQQYSIQYIWE